MGRGTAVKRQAPCGGRRTCHPCRGLVTAATNIPYCLEFFAQHRHLSLWGGGLTSRATGPTFLEGQSTLACGLVVQAKPQPPKAAVRELNPYWALNRTGLPEAAAEAQQGNSGAYVHVHNVCGAATLSPFSHLLTLI